jgi:hypothetical protein
MSQSGQTRSWGDVRLYDRSSTENGSRSAILLCRRSATTGREQVQQDSRLFDHLVGTGEQRRWYIEAQRLSALEVDDQLESGRLDDRQIGRFLTLENSA